MSQFRKIASRIQAQKGLQGKNPKGDVVEGAAPRSELVSGLLHTGSLDHGPGPSKWQCHYAAGRLGSPALLRRNLQEVELRFEGFIEEVALVPKPSAEVLVGPLKIVNSKFPGVHPPVFVAKASLWR